MSINLFRCHKMLEKFYFNSINFFNRIFTNNELDCDFSLNIKLFNNKKKKKVKLKKCLSMASRI